MSILKPRKPRQPLQAINLGHSVEEEDTAEVRQRRVSFAGVKKTKEFNADAESLVICDTPAYEEEFTASSDSSQIIKDLNSPRAFLKISINERENGGDSDMVLSCVNEKNVSVNSTINQFNYSSSKNLQEVHPINHRSAGCSYNGQYQDQINLSEDSMDITGLGDPPESPKSEHCTSNMNLCGDSFMINSPCGNQKNFIEQSMNKKLFDCSSVNAHSKVLKHESSMLHSSSNISGYNSSYISVTELNPVMLKDQENHVLNSPSGSQLSDVSKPLCSQSPAPKRYRLSDFPDPESDMEITQNDYTLPKQYSYHQKSSQVSFTHPAGLQFGLSYTPAVLYKNTSISSKPLEDSTFKVSVNADISKNEIPNSDDLRSDNKECESYISSLPILDKICHGAENSYKDGFSVIEFDSPNIDHDSEEANRKEDESSGETMDLSQIAEKFLNLKKQANNDAADTSGNEAQVSQCRDSFIKTSNHMLIVNELETKNESILQLSSEPIINQTLADNRDVSKISDFSLNPASGQYYEFRESDIDSSLNAVRNENKRKLDKLKIDDIGHLKLPEARVDQVFSSADCLAVRHSQRWVSDRVSSNITLEKEIIQQDALYNEIKHNEVHTSENIRYDHIVNKSDSELHSALMEIENLSHEPIIEISPLPGDFEKSSCCEPLNEMSISDHKLYVPINESLKLSDHINKSKRLSNNLEDEDCGKVDQLSPITDNLKSQESGDVNGISPSPGQLKCVSYGPAEQESQSADLFENQSQILLNKVSLLDRKNINQEHIILADENGENLSEKVLTPKKIVSSLPCEKDEHSSITPQSPSPTSIQECIETPENNEDTSVNCTLSSEQFLLSNVSHCNNEINVPPEILDDNITHLPTHPESKLKKDTLKDYADPVFNCDKDLSTDKQPVDIDNEELNNINKLVLNMSVSDEVNLSVMEEEHVVDRSTSSLSTLSDVTLPGKVLSPLQRHNKYFMQDLNYHYWEWTEWMRKFFKKSVILTIKVPWVQFDSKTPLIDVSLTSVIVNEDEALNFCSANLVQRLIDMKALAKFNCIDDSEEMFAFIQNEVDRITPFYESLYDACHYKALKIVNERLVIRVVNFKPRLVSFDVFLSLTNWMELSESNLSLNVFYGKVRLSQIKSIFACIPDCKEKLYEFACALERL